MAAKAPKLISTYTPTQVANAMLANVPFWETHGKKFAKGALPAKFIDVDDNSIMVKFQGRKLMLHRRGQMFIINSNEETGSLSQVSATVSDLATMLTGIKEELVPDDNSTED